MFNMPSVMELFERDVGWMGQNGCFGPTGTLLCASGKQKHVFVLIQAPV